MTSFFFLSSSISLLPHPQQSHLSPSALCALNKYPAVRNLPIQLKLGCVSLLWLVFSSQSSQAQEPVPKLYPSSADPNSYTSMVDELFNLKAKRQKLLEQKKFVLLQQEVLQLSREVKQLQNQPEDYIQQLEADIRLAAVHVQQELSYVWLLDRTTAKVSRWLTSQPLLLQGRQWKVGQSMIDSIELISAEGTHAWIQR